MPASDSTRFLIDHPNVGAELVSLICQFLARRIDLDTFWKRYSFLYVEVPAGAVPDQGMELFSQVHERLSYVDDKSSPHPADPTEFRSWLAGVLEAGGWSHGAR